MVEDQREGLEDQREELEDHRERWRTIESGGGPEGRVGGLKRGWED